MKIAHAILAAATATLLSTAAFAAGSHAGGHAEMMAVGQPGEAADVTRSIDIIMRETDDGAMIYEPNSVTVKKGDTIRFAIRNKGELEHEFVLDEHAGLMKHMEVMMKAPDMEHDDPNSVRLDPGMDGEIIWTFANTGEFEFGCLIPGHYQSGMKGTVAVGSK